MRGVCLFWRTLPVLFVLLALRVRRDSDDSVSEIEIGVGNVPRLYFSLFR